MRFLFASLELLYFALDNMIDLQAPEVISHTLLYFTLYDEYTINSYMQISLGFPVSPLPRVPVWAPPVGLGPAC